MMKPVVFLMCLLGSTFAAPAPESGSNEQVAAHANMALRMMEFYRMYGSLQQQGVGAAGNPAFPAVPGNAAAAPPPSFFMPPPMPAGSDEEGAPQYAYGYGLPAGAAPAAPLNSDEVGEDAAGAEAEAAEAEAEPAAAEAEPAAEAAVPEAAAPVDVVPALPEVSMDIAVAVPAGADIGAAVDAATADAVDFAAAAAASFDPALVPQGSPIAVDIDTTVLAVDTPALV
ncbi:enamelin [Osmerus eperlanus]|uniref:enamelin n=1 Tax=Osmerus eperlanus TaxID=29151 RepID=UPI002E0E54BD